MAETVINSRRKPAPVRSPPYRFVALLWFLYLFAPAKLLAFYIPPARPLTWLPEFLLWICALQWLRSPVEKRGYPAYTRFFALMVIGTILAFFIGNWGMARETLRQMYQYYLLGLITLTFCSTPQRVRPILRLYFGYFLWYGIWGLISLKVSPLSDDINPGARSIVYWHPNFDNRDAFGPLMVAGLAYSIYYFQATKAIRTRIGTAWTVLSILLGILGFVTSFGRGAFVGFIAAATSMWLKSGRKIAALAITAVVIVSFSLLAPKLTARYWTSMQTITGEGMDTGTGADRKGLWNVAWREFMWSPIIGVGTSNYGIATQRVVRADEDVGHGYTQGRLWGRSVHSAPLTILSEYGTIGALAALLLVGDFFITNRRTRIRGSLPSAEATDEAGFPPGYLKAIALGLHAAFLTFCVAGIFYEIIYTPLYWTVIVLNRMLYFASGAHLAANAAPRLKSDGQAG
jgi:hypothetical protein